MNLQTPLYKEHLSYLPSLVFVLFIGYYFFAVTGVQKVISWDTLGYYLYLPSTFLYDDMALDKFDMYAGLISQYDLSSTFYQVDKTEVGHHINKYSMGIAVLYSPFYFIADLIAMFTDYARDGFSYPYQMMLHVGGYFYTVLGLLLMVKVLRFYYSQAVVVITTICLLFGTNYLISASLSTTMPHNLLFALYAFILYQTIKWHKTYSLKNMVLLSVALGVLILARPSELVAVFIPLLWGIKGLKSVKEKLMLLKKYKAQFLVAVLILVSCGMPQFLYWKILAGKWLVSDYGNPAEGLDLLTPHVLDVLFSFRKGWYLYTPIMLLATVGFVVLKRRKPELFYAILVFFILNLYLVSSWSCWWYATSFSCRALVQSSVVLLFPLAELINYAMKQKWRGVMYSILVLLVLLNLFQSWQYKEGIIHSSRMTKAAYFSVLGKTERPANYSDLLMVERVDDGGFDKLPDLSKIKRTKSLQFDFDDVTKGDLYGASAYSGQGGEYMNSEKEFTPAIKIPFNEITQKEHAWIDITVKVKSSMPGKEHPFSLVTLFEYQEKPYKYQVFNAELMSLEVGEWCTVKRTYLTPEVRTKKDLFVMYFWNRSQQHVTIDELKIDIYEKKE